MDRLRFFLPLGLLSLLVFAPACDTFGGGGEETGAASTENAPEGTPQANVESPETALERWVQNRLNVGFVANCDDASRPDDIGKQCATRRGERDGMFAFELGPAFSDYTRLIILSRAGDSWTIAHMENRDPNAPDVPGIPWPLQAGAELVVAGTDPDCLRIREQPGVDAEQVECLADGTDVLITEGPVQIDDFDWWRLEGYGWAVGNYLRYEEDVEDAPPVEGASDATSGQ
jgi:hypothetical protein